MMMKMASYPFEQRSTQLMEIIPSSSRIAARRAMSNAFGRFVTLLGSIYSDATVDRKKDLTALVREGQIDIPFQSASQPAGAGTTAPTISQTETQYPQIMDGGLNRHTSALNRYCDRKGLAVDWPTTEVAAPRTRFRCVARVDGREFEGVGKNTRDAKHNASRKACMAFGIEV